jgi:hypothetical protein
MLEEVQDILPKCRLCKDSLNTRQKSVPPYSRHYRCSGYADFRNSDITVKLSMNSQRLRAFSRA